MSHHVLYFQGVVIADIDEKNGNSAVDKLNKTFENRKIVFIKTDVTVADQLEGNYILCIHNIPLTEKLPATTS